MYVRAYLSFMKMTKLLARKTHLLLYTHHPWLGVSETGVSEEKRKEGEKTKTMKEIERQYLGNQTIFSIHSSSAGSLCAPRATNEEAAAALLL